LAFNSPGSGIFLTFLSLPNIPNCTKHLPRGHVLPGTEGLQEWTSSSNVLPGEYPFTLGLSAPWSWLKHVPSNNLHVLLPMCSRDESVSNVNQSFLWNHLTTINSLVTGRFPWMNTFESERSHSGIIVTWKHRIIAYHKCTMTSMIPQLFSTHNLLY
jgi:hypothetical protein